MLKFRKQDTYTVNFNNISIIELIRFASKITKLNFVFEEADLQFSVTVVSEERHFCKKRDGRSLSGAPHARSDPARARGNVLITNKHEVNQIPPIVSADLPEFQGGQCRAGHKSL